MIQFPMWVGKPTACTVRTNRLVIPATLEVHGARIIEGRFRNIGLVTVRSADGKLKSQYADGLVNHLIRMEHIR